MLLPHFFITIQINFCMAAVFSHLPSVAYIKEHSVFIRVLSDITA